MKINPHLIVISTFLFLGCTESEKTEKTNLDNLVIRNKILEEAIPGEAKVGNRAAQRSTDGVGESVARLRGACTLRNGRAVPDNGLGGQPEPAVARARRGRRRAARRYPHTESGHSIV